MNREDDRAGLVSQEAPADPAPADTSVRDDWDHGLGWLPDLPDVRDYTAEDDGVAQLVEKMGVFGVDAARASAAVDLRPWCSPVEDQQSIGSCTAQAGVGIVEYFQRRAFGKHLDGSRLFVYKATRNLLGWTGDTGAYIRSAMGALAFFGVPPEQHWPYRPGDYEREPPAFVYALAQSYQAEKYYRLDTATTQPSSLLASIKQHLVSGLPSMFGFTVYDSIRQASATGRIPFPEKADRAVGGHAVMAVGYDDNLAIRHAAGRRATTGALLIRNSWGTGWGERGYGWLPYEYVLNRLAVDWWALVSSEWLDAAPFSE